MEINWDMIGMFELQTLNFEQLQFQMNNIYGVNLSESTRTNYQKLINIMQMIILYNEYSNFQLNETNQQLNIQLNNITKKISIQEEKLLKSKERIKKSKKQKIELKQIKTIKNQVFGCLYCNNEFKDSILLDRHMEIHKEPPNIISQILAIQKELQGQLAYIYEVKQQRKQYELMKEDLQCGIIAAAERNTQLQSNSQYNRIQKLYEEKIQNLQQILQQIDEKQQQQQLQFNETQFDRMQEKIQDALNFKKEQEEIFQKQLDKKLQESFTKRQSSSQFIDKKENSVTSLKQQTQVFIQSQSGGSNHKFRRSIMGIEYHNDSDVAADIILEEEELQQNEIQNKKTKNSQNIHHSKQNSGISHISEQAKTQFEQYEKMRKDFINLSIQTLQNKVKEKNSNIQIEDNKNERQMIQQELDQQMNFQNLEEQLKNLQQTNILYEKRKKKQITNKESENLIISDSESNSEDKSEKSSDNSLQEIYNHKQLNNFPFSISKEEEQQKQIPEQGKNQGYGINTFSINY